MRRRNLAFEHHKLVAKLPPPEQDKWLDLAEKHNIGKRRLARSIDFQPLIDILKAIQSEAQLRP